MMQRPYRYASLVLVAASTISSPSRTQASDPAISFPPNPDIRLVWEGSDGATRGWGFNVTNVPGIRVTHLSLFDSGLGGFAYSHDLGIWNASGDLLASATVPAGDGQPLDPTGYFRTVDITDVVLPAASGYVIGAWYRDVGVGSSADGVTVGSKTPQNTSEWITHPAIEYDLGYQRYRFGSSLQFPTTRQHVTVGTFGPSFLLIPIPEPGTFALAGIACAVLAMLRSKAYVV